VNSIKVFFQWLLLINISFFFVACSFTANKKIEPAFTQSIDSILRDLNSIIFAPQTSIQGHEVNSNGKVTTELTINLFNPKGLPNDTNEQSKIGEYIATLLKQALKDANTFTDYKVLFVNKVVDGTTTTSNYTGYSYKSVDLKNYIQIVSLGDKFDPSISQAIGKTTFSKDDLEIVSVFKYYNNMPGSPIKLKMYKDTDSGSVLLTVREQGQILPGNNFLLNKFKTMDFYEIKELNFGTYKIEYRVNDTIVGAKYFKLL
jgi:hypothetical protein